MSFLDGSAPFKPTDMETIIEQQQRAKKIRSELVIGQRVRVVPDWMNKDLPKPKSGVMYVRELHNPNCAGLSYTMDTPPEKSYGILYHIIKPTLSEEEREILIELSKQFIKKNYRTQLPD